MKRNRLFMFAALCAWPLMAQTVIDLTRQAKLESGLQLPGQCSVGQLFLQSNPAAASSLYVCTAANTWSGPVVYSAGTGIAITGTSIGADDAVVPLYYAGTGAPALSCVAGRDYYVDTNAGAFYYCKTDGNWQPVSNVGHTHVAGDVTSGTFSASLMPSGIAWTNQSNTYTPGQTQAVSHSPSTAGLRLVPAAGDPANAQDGDLWYNSTTGTFRQHQNGVVADWGSGASHRLLSTTHTDTSPATAIRGDMITAQGAAATWSRLGLGAAGSYLRSNGTDLLYAPIPISDLPSGYLWNNLANVPVAFTPSSHAVTHLSNGSDAIAAATASVRGTVTITTSNSQVVSTDDSRMTNARTPTAHASTHQNGGSDEIASATPAANAIPKAGSGGVLAPGWLPAPAAATLGGVQSKDCTGTGHILKINTDGSVTCSADAGGSGGTTMAGEIRPWGDVNQNEGSNSGPISSAPWYFRFTPQTNIPIKHFIMLAASTSSSTHEAFALYDSTCTKIAGSDYNGTGLGTSQSWVYGTLTGAPVTLTAGSVYYFGMVAESAWTYTDWNFAWSPFYSGGVVSSDMPYFSGSNAATGAGSSLTMPSTCGTQTRILDLYKPIVIFSTY